MQDPYNSPNSNLTQYPHNPHQAPRVDGYAITSMVLGILAVLTCYFGIVLGTIAVIFGHVSLNQIKKHNLGGKGMAIAGLACGYVGILMSLVAGAALLFGANTFKDVFEEEMAKQRELQQELQIEMDKEETENPIELEEPVEE